VRTYGFEYDDAHAADSFGKSLLAAVSLRSNPGDPASELYRHTFDYFKAPAADAMFAPPIVWGPLFQPDGSPRADDGLDHANDQLFGGSGSVGIGFLDFFSATVSGGGDSGETAPDLELVDANGDGMPDQIDRGGNLSVNSIFGPDAQHFAGAQFPGVGTIGHTNRSGWTAGGSLSALEGLFGVGASYSQHTAEDDQLLADMNGDGFPDIVTVDSGAVSVRLNNGLQQYGPPQPWGATSLGGVAFTRQDRWGQAGQAGAFFPSDPLIRWVAPFAGTVTVDTTLAKVRAGGDGARADLFVNAETSPRWTCAFAAGDLDPCAQSLTLTVAAGDRLYTKVTSLGEPSFDELTASINVAYQVGSGQAGQVDPTGAPLYRYNQAEDFRMAGLPSVPWAATADGDVLVTPCFTKGATPDDVVASAIQRRGGSGPVVARFDLPVAAGATGSFCIPALQQPLHVQADDTIGLEVTSSSQIDPASVSWPATVAYQSYCRIDPRSRASVCGAPVCAAGFCTIGPGDPLRDFPIPEGFTHGPADVFVPAFEWTAHTPAPTQSFVATASGTPRLTWTVTTNGPRVLLLVQGVNRLFSKLQLDATTPTAHVDVSPDVRAGDQIFFTAFFPDGDPAPGAASVGAPAVDGAAAPANVLFPDPRLDNNGALTQARDPMSGGWHRWFYGDWNGSRAFTEGDIRPSASPSATDSFLFATPAPLGLPSRPDLGPTPMWIGRGAGELMAAGRVNPGFSSSGASTGQGTGVGALRVSDTWNLDLQATAVGVNAAVNAGDSTTDVDLFDVNGDRFPDSVTAGGVQLSDGVGSFGPRLPLDMGFGDVRSTKNASLRFGFDLGVIGQLINLSDSHSESSKSVSTSVASASTDYGVSSTRVDFVDVNGDGLVDHVEQSPGEPGVSVRLNLGHGFSQPVLWRASGWQRGEIPASFLTFNAGGIASDVISGALGVVPGDPTSTNALRFGDSQTNNLSVGVPGQTFGAGGGPTATLTRRIVDLVDLNGDGLPDQMMRAPDEDRRTFRVKLNMGDHFGPETTLSIPDWEVDDRLPAEDLLAAPDGVGYSTMAGWSASAHFQVCFILCVGGSAFYSRDNGGTNMRFEDVDGDGKPDQVLKIAGDPNVYVKLNQTGKTNLLRTVHRPLGGTIAIDYARVGNHVDLAASPKVDMPGNLWALASTASSSGQPDSQPGPLLETVDYSTFGSGLADGFYDRRERESYGFGDVKTVFPEEGTSVARRFANQDYYQKGLPLSTTFNQVDATGQALQRQSHTYADPSGRALPDPVADARTGTFFPAPRDTETDYLEADPGGRSKRHLETHSYDTAGNLTDVVDVGDVDFADPSDDFNLHVDYVHPDAAGLITRASAVSERSGQSATSGVLLRRRTATYLSTGAAGTVTDTIAGGKDPATGAPRTEGAPALANWTLSYDVFGNVASATSPEGHASAYEYDPTARTYRTRTTDLSFGYVSTADYDLRFGTASALVDIDGAREEVDRDDFGRQLRVFGPKDFDGSGARTTPSLTFDYSEQPHAPPSPSQPVAEILPASATTSHKNAAPPEMSRPGDPIAERPPIRTVSFVDGLGRVVQTKSDIARDDGQGNVTVGMSVSGVVGFDSRGRVFQQGQPTFEPGGGTGYVAGRAPLNPATFAYDVLSRQRQVTRPDASSVDAAAHSNQAVTTTSFQLGVLDGKLYRVELQQDARGEVRTSYRSVRDENVATDEVNRIRGVDGVHLVTRYAYDPLSQLLSATDALGNVTAASYDTVGNMVALTSPDAGRTERRYDRSGNLAAKETANLRAQGKLVTYVHNKDRLEAILYPDSADVQYVFGDATETGAANGFVAGRIKRRIDESGTVDFQYDELGDVVKETSALVSLVPSQKNGYQAAMTYSYDSFGRMLEMTFPGASAEVVRYGYDAGGQVTSARGVYTVVNPPLKSPDTIYLQHIGYDELGKRTRQVAGNGVVTGYAYEPDTRRLAQVNTDYRDPAQVKKNLGPLPLQRLRYAYDVVANVRTLQNAVPVDGHGGAVDVSPTSFTYDYDRLYQLTHVDGLNQDMSNKRSRYSLDYAYDEIGNIAQKSQQDFREQASASGVFQPGQAVAGTSYRLDYQYAGAGPHAASHVDETTPNNQLDGRDLAHDGDGNQTGWTFRNGQQRVQTWNEEDRLRSVQDQGHVVGQYLYNAGGGRTHNAVDGRELVYMNQYVTLHANGPSTFTKHIYAGNTRIASKLDSDGGGSSPATFWYHGDQMQSTEYVTADDQSVVEHHEYFASGESWQDEGNGQLERVGPEALFDGKELDASTSYYYFGARCYDPKIQNWQSGDPALNSYLRGAPAGGVFQPRNLGLYTFAWNSPAVVRDPDGRSVYRDDTLAKPEKDLLAGIQQETDDKVVFDHGILQIDKEATGPLKHPEGTKLVRRLVNMEHVVRLTAVKAGTGHFTVRLDDGTTDPKLGFDSVIGVDVGAIGGPLLTAGKNGNFIDRKVPFVIGLYHELIHADINARPGLIGGEAPISFTTEKGRFSWETVDKSELRVVGLGYNQPDDVTENQVRQEQGLGERRAYYYPRIRSGK
jgi:RHS repeat-associated protein